MKKNTLPEQTQNPVIILKNIGGKMYNKYFKHEKGITGLETAIILIAFVVVAAVFAYTALSAGLFSTQKAQEAVYSGLKEAQSTMELRGSVIATANATGTNGGVVQQISFVVANVLGGQAIDFTQPTASGNDGKADSTSPNKVVIKYIDADQTVNDLYWTATPLGSNNSNSLLEANEKFQIVIGNGTKSTGGGNLIDALTTKLGANKTFTLEVVSPSGAVLTIERTTPAYITTKMDLR
jgi:archaeal flagellin FlaB